MAIIRRGVTYTGILVQTAAGNVAVKNEAFVYVNKAVGQATTVTLPPAPRRGRTIQVVDAKGDAATNPITVAPAAGTISGASNYVIGDNYGSAVFSYNGSEWDVMSQGNRSNLTFVSVAASSPLSGNTSTAIFDQNYTIRANRIKAGTYIRVKHSGIVTAHNASDTLSLGHFLDWNTSLNMVSVNGINPVVNGTFTGEINIVCRTAGPSGTAIAWGTYKSPANVSQSGNLTDFTTNSFGLNTTTPKLVAVGAAWGSNNVGNSCRLDSLTVEVY
jgi:hypothetical protein